MTYDSWKNAVSALLARTCPKSDLQDKLADVLKVKLEADLPIMVAAAKLRVSLSEPLCLPKARIPSDDLIDYLKSLSGDKKLALDSLTREEVEAWIAHCWLLQRLNALEQLKLERGDIVQRKDRDPDEKYEVSSIGDDGRIYFKGGRAKAWPDTLEIVCRSSDTSENAKEARRMSSNLAVMRQHTSGWSFAKRSQLKEYAVEPALGSTDIERMRRLVEDAADEKPIQTFLEQRPHILVSLLGGHECFFLSRPRLGAEYVPDFLIADVDSMGIRWVAVELETPHSAITLQDGSDFDKYARKGISQINQWREWLKDNIAYARQPKSENGLGLIGIRPECDGLVLVGRRSRLKNKADVLRKRLWEKERTLVRTYDNIIEQFENISKFSGPPASNPFLLHPPSERWAVCERWL